MSAAPTMVDVAREAQVGLKTVSRYVNGETNIDPALVERIRVAIAELGYRRNLAAASIRPGWTAHRSSSISPMRRRCAQDLTTPPPISTAASRR